MLHADRLAALLQLHQVKIGVLLAQNSLALNTFPTRVAWLGIAQQRGGQVKGERSLADRLGAGKQNSVPQGALGNGPL